MNRADLRDAFTFDGALLELTVEDLDAAGLCTVLADFPLPWTFLLDGEPAPLPDATTLRALVEEAEHTLEVSVDPAGLRLILMVNFGLPPLTATLHPNDVPDEAAFDRLTLAMTALAGPERRVWIQPEGADLVWSHAWAVFTAERGWHPPAPPETP
ncbi:hypothetical protein [Deinococcus multiflagellatus]|uniref:Uncharacterized protein n=1 Tax=Deinococcus multiflagellatus TaxID=1656887 RepID=A0ABW1ZEH4_9DEIO|nr:hypothetical protein [Deinococcus multiflagellatus]MBZ9712957.1 hypothetical protein [Deinococcus multiflagellatus]